MRNVYTDFMRKLLGAIASKSAPVGGDSVIIDNSEDPGGTNTILLSSIPMAQSQVAKGIREIANDGAVALLTTDSSIIIANSTTGNKAITTTSSHAGQIVRIRLVLCTGNSYTLALVSGTLTINAAEESPTIVRNAANTGWLVLDLGGATIV